jgi:hypothetical protein
MDRRADIYTNRRDSPNRQRMDTTDKTIQTARCMKRHTDRQTEGWINKKDRHTNRHDNPDRHTDMYTKRQGSPNRQSDRQTHTQIGTQTDIMVQLGRGM